MFPDPKILLKEWRSESPEYIRANMLAVVKRILENYIQ
jgi:hypothetical protein